MRLPVLLFALFLCCIAGSPAGLRAQCPGTVSAGTDRYLCFPGGTVNLAGTATPGYTGILWSPADGVSNTGILNPSVNVNGAGPHTYTLSAKYRLPGNLVVNGNFSSGDTGFSSDYMAASNLTPEGLYSVINNPNLVHPGFSPCSDHTGGNGNMMVVNGAGTPNLNVWCQTITVAPNTEYQFETWVTSVAGGSPALLQFSINGNTIGPIFQAPASTCTWQRFSATWLSESNTTATVCIVNQNTALGGNDFALDDITFHAICTVTDEVTIHVREKAESFLDTTICSGTTITIGNTTLTGPLQQEIRVPGAAAGGCDSFVQLNLDVIELEVDVQQPDKITCYNQSEGVQLYGEVLNYPAADIVYRWINPMGQIISNTNSATVFEPGFYTLKVTYTGHTPPCAAANTTVYVERDTAAPLALAGPDLKLGCAGDSLVIQAGNSTQDPTLSIAWYTTGGHFVNGANTLTPEVDSAGIYVLYLTNPENGCADLDTMIVLPNTGLPDVIIRPASINCHADTILLDASASDQGTIYTYQWTSSDGTIVSGATTLNPEISSPGTYQLTIVDTTGPCQNSASVTIAVDTLAPVAEAGPGDTLNCQLSLAELSGAQSSTGMEFTYQWTGPGIVGSSDTILIRANQAGVYYLTVIDTTNGCQSLDSAEIKADAIPPLADAGPDTLLNCKAPELTLSGAGSQGGQLIYQWQTQDGLLLSKADSVEVLIGADGTYILVVTDLSNNCSREDTIVITENFTLPLAEAGAMAILDCSSPELSLDGSGSSAGTAFIYQWTTQNGTIVSGDQSLSPVVSKDGWYYIEVQDTVNGCSSIDSVEVQKDANVPSALIDLPDTLTCSMTQLAIDAGNSSNGAEFSYSWQAGGGGNIVSGGNGLNPMVNAAGTYILTVTNMSNNCSSSASVEVEIDTLHPQALIDPPLPLNCKNPSVQLDGSGSTGGSNIFYTWTFDNIAYPGGDQFTAGEPGVYSLQVENQDNNCIASTNVTVVSNVNGPVYQSLSDPIITCQDPIVRITATAQGTHLVYSLEDEHGDPVANTGADFWDVSAGGDYQSIVTDTLTGCKDTLNTFIDTDTLAPALAAYKSGELTCLAESVTLFADQQSNPDYLYSWQSADGEIGGPADQFSIQALQGGTYTIRVEDAGNGCLNTDTIQVTAPSLPQGSLLAEDPLCAGESGGLRFEGITGGLAPYEYALEDGDFQDSGYFGNLVPGDYSVTLRDANGCEIEASASIIAPEAVELNANPEIEILSGKATQLLLSTNLGAAEIRQIEWTPATGLSCSDCLNPIVTLTENTTYRIIIYNQNGCSDTAQIEVRVKINPAVFIPNGFSPNGDGDNDFFFVNGNSEVERVESMLIFDRWGDMVASYEDLPVNEPGSGWDGTTRGKALNPAVFVYTVVVRYKNGKTERLSGDVSLTR